jgi:hypothetical protein
MSYGERSKHVLRGGIDKRIGIIAAADALLMLSDKKYKQLYGSKNKMWHKNTR